MPVDRGGLRRLGVRVFGARLAGEWQHDPDRLARVLVRLSPLGPSGGMSFGEDVRRELVERPPAKTCCRAAFLSGLMRAAGSLQMRSGGELAVRARAGRRGGRAAGLRRCCGRPERTARSSRYREPRFGRRTWSRCACTAPRSLQLLHELGVLSPGLRPLAAPPRRVVARRCCRGAYLRGALVAAGSVSAPREPGHLELRADDADAADLLAALAGEDGLPLGWPRGVGMPMPTPRASTTIRDLLVHVGAHDAALSLRGGGGDRRHPRAGQPR